MTIPRYTTDSAAARLAILVARSAVVSKRSHHAIRGYRIGDAVALLSADQAAAQLASRAKPVIYRAQLQHDVIHIEFVLLQQATFAATEIRRRGRRERATESALEFLGSRHGEESLGTLAVVCHGAGDLIMLSVSDVDGWARDYVYDGAHGYGADFADSNYPRAHGVTHSELASAVGFMNFGWGDGVSYAIELPELPA